MNEEDSIFPNEVNKLRLGEGEKLSPQTDALLKELGRKLSIEELNYIANIDADITRLHGEAGVPDSSLKHPLVFLIPEQNWYQVKAHLKLDEDSTGVTLDNGNVVAAVERKEKLGTIRVLYHEMMHGNGQSKSSYENYKLGYATYSEDNTTGLALEEGLVEHTAFDYLAREFNYHSPDVPLENRDRYRLSRDMVSTLIQAGGDEMEKLLVAARVDVARKPALIEKLKKTLKDPNAWERINETQFNSESIRETINWIKEKTV